MTQPASAPCPDRIAAEVDELLEAAEALGYFDAEGFEPDDLNETDDWEWAP